MKQLTVLTENKPGVLADIATLLGDNGVNMQTISAETFADGAIIRLITKDTNTAKRVLSQAAYKVNESNVLIFRILDRAGELGKIAKMLSREKINIENVYLLTREDQYAFLALKVNDEAKARKIFSKYITDF